MAAKPYRLLALVKQDAVVRVQKEPDDTVMTWPHLLSIEFFAAAIMSIFLLLMGVFVNAPLEELANPNVTPAVAKAPWYLVGIQELLAYFHPTSSPASCRSHTSSSARWSSRTSIAVRGATAARLARADRKTGILLFTMFAPPACSSRSWAPSSAARATPSPCRGRTGFGLHCRKERKKGGGREVRG